MKKIIFYFTLIVLSNVTVAQRDSSAFPEAGNVFFEVNFNPLNHFEAISIDNLQMKFMLTDKFVFRLAGVIASENQTQDDSDYDSDEEYKLTSETNSLLWGVKPGVEYHLLSARKVSPYIGAEFYYSQRKSRSSFQGIAYEYPSAWGSSDEFSSYKYVYDIETEGAWRSHSFMDGSLVNSNQNRSFTAIGCNLLIGSDFYLMKNFYMGFEVGLLVQKKKYEQIIMKRINHPTEYITEFSEGFESEETEPSFSETEVGLMYNNAIRLGIWF